jgi:ABC-type sugar transport system ATPase subunit
LGSVDEKYFTSVWWQLGITAVYVTHDQSEAMNMTNRIVVMNVGLIDQVGSPRATDYGAKCKILAKRRRHFLGDQAR